MHERDAILQLHSKSDQSVLATVVEVFGSAYRRPGARMLLNSAGQSAGVINGGCLDGDLQARAEMVHATQTAQVAIYDTTSSQDIVFGLGLGCRGVVKIVLEPVRDLDWLAQNVVVEVVYEGEQIGTRLVEDVAPTEARSGQKSFVEHLEAPQELLIFGAGADVLPLQRIAEAVGWNVQTFDLRALSPSRPVFVEAKHIAPEHLTELPISVGAACVIMTHNFLHDLELLKHLLVSPAAYLGLLGPRRRRDELVAQLGGDTLLPGISPTPEQLARLFAPIGLDLGAETPEEIALSIVAEIQRVKRGKSGGSLRERGSIH